jgi:sulfite exporter TauE/SafE
MIEILKYSAFHCITLCGPQAYALGPMQPSMLFEFETPALWHDTILCNTFLHTKQIMAYRLLIDEYNVIIIKM